MVSGRFTPPAEVASDDRTLAALRDEQRAIAARAILHDALGPVRHIAGIDVSGTRFEAHLHAAVVVLAFPALTEVARVGLTRLAPLPYLTGLLAFREVPALLEAFAQLPLRPDLLVVDGQGIAHPRRCGIATHLGVVLDLPAIGVAKSRLLGAPEAPLAEAVGSSAPILDRGEVVGALLRTRRGANPLHVSIGHRVSLETALAWVRACGRGWRLPEPTRQAHAAAGAVRSAAAVRQGQRR